MSKTLLFLTGLFLSIGNIYAQEFEYVSSDEYDALKSAGTLTGNEVILQNGMIDVDSLEVYQEFTISSEAQGCGGYFDPPGPAQLVSSTDDGGLNNTNPFSLPFTFCFFGDNYTQFWVNNNGNVSFDGFLSAFSSTAFPSNGNVMLAPFWADLDFGGGGTLHCTITATAVIVNWVEAGYFSDQWDKQNTFQLVFTDGTDPLVQGGNVAFHYADMQWTTGSASGGSNGFGGTPATAGANRGNNQDFFQIGQFDHEGTDYDGPNGATDGVSWLDNKSFYFDFCNAGNVAPIPLETAYCDTFQVCSVGDTINLSFPFSSPEANQTTTVTYNAPSLNNEVVISNVPGTIGEITIQVVGANESIGFHDIEITATDDGTPTGVTVVNYVLEVVDASTVFLTDPVLNYVYDCAPVNVTVDNGPFEDYTWPDGSSTDNYDIPQAMNDILSVTVEISGCKFTIDSLVAIPGPPMMTLGGNDTICEGMISSRFELLDSLSMSSVTWGLSDPVLDALYSNDLVPGTYTISVTDTSGMCPNDTTFTVTEITGPTVESDAVGCNMTHQVTGTSAYDGGVWSSTSSEISFSPDATVDNPIITTTVPGDYTVSFTDNYCNQTVTLNVGFPEDPWAVINDTVLCDGISHPFSAVGSTTIDLWEWNNGMTGQSISIAEGGEYIVTATNECGSINDTAQVVFQLCDVNAPNVISLSSEVGNDLWTVDAEGVQEFTCVIVNRWGSVIAEFDDVNGAWDGTDKGGNKVEGGTYFYKIEATLINNEHVTKQGFIHVIE